MGIHLDQNIINNQSVSNDALAVYCVLRSIMKQEKSDYVITANQLLFEATGQTLISKYNKTCFLRGLNELIKMGIVSLKYEFNISEKLLDLSSIALCKGDGIRFTTIDLSEIQTILNNCGTNRYSVLRYFILLIGTFNPSIIVSLSEDDQASRILSTMPIDYLCRISGLSKSTVLTYNKILEDLQLLYIYHAADYYRTDEKSIRSPPNVYARYYDKKYVDQYVENDAIYQGYEKYNSNKKVTANHKRRLAQRYNRVISETHNYSVEEIQEVYDYILDSNKKYQALYDKSQYKPYIEKIRDTSKLEQILKKSRFNT